MRNETGWWESQNAVGTSVCLARLQDRRHCSRWIRLDVSVHLGRQVGGYSAIVDGRNDPATCSGCLAVFFCVQGSVNPSGDETETETLTSEASRGRRVTGESLPDMASIAWYRIASIVSV